MVRGKWLGAWVLMAGLAGLLPAMAGSGAIGSVVGARNAVLDGQSPLPNTTVLNGDRLRVNDGLAMVTLQQGNRMILGRETEASFSQEADGVTVSLQRGNVSLFQPQSSKGVRVKVGDVTVIPAEGYKTLGEVAMADGLVVVTAKDGALQVEKAGTTKQVSTGKTITIPTGIPRAPMPNPSGNRHLKVIWGNIPEIAAVAAIAGGVAATALVLANRGTKQVSPSAP